MKHRYPIIEPCSAHDMFARLAELNIGGQRVDAPVDAGGVDGGEHGVFVVSHHSGNGSCRACSAAFAIRARAMSA